jgi:hypothetical protein
MAHWSWLAADSHIEWEYERVGVPEAERMRPAINFTVDAERADLGDYPYAQDVLGRLAILSEVDGTEARTELVFEMAPYIEQAS